MTKQAAGSSPMRPRARLLRTLGRDLISSENVALLELVKNSYDADASRVVVRFIGPASKDSGSIEVWDDGHGMDASTIQEAWLDLATTTKSDTKRSESGRRRVLGEKGIGRLAASRLGGEMLVVTRRLAAAEVSLFIDWSKFDRAGAYLDEVTVNWDVGEATVFEERAVTGAGVAIRDAICASGHGTVIQIHRLSRDWNAANLQSLRLALARLVRPKPSSRGGVADDFAIHIEVDSGQPAFADFSGLVESPDELELPHYSLIGSVDADGVAELVFSTWDGGAGGVESRVLWVGKQRPPACGPVDIEIKVWDRDRDALAALLDGKSSGALRSALDDVAGVSVYRDGFRVLPFGEPGDDWLGLDLRRVQSPTLRLSNNQIIGHVFIGSDSNPGLVDQSNREGFLDSQATSDLRDIVKAAIAIVETRRYKGRRPKRPEGSDRGGLFQRFDIGDVREVVATRYPSDASLLEVVDAREKEIAAGVQEVQRVLAQYSRLATLGLLIDRVLHDGRTAVTHLKTVARHGSKDIEGAGLNSDLVRGIAGNALTEVAAQAEVLGGLFNQIEPFGGRRRGRPVTVEVSAVLEQAVRILAADAKESGVDVTITPTDVQVQLDPGEFLAVLVNLLSNAIYWAATRGVEETRQVALLARRNLDESVTVVVSDSGPGVPPDQREYIFDPYFSGKPDGVGLGLSIVGNIVESLYGGELTLVADGPLPGATFEATFRRRV